jgi:hypothetical protein
VFLAIRHHEHVTTGPKAKRPNQSSKFTAPTKTYTGTFSDKVFKTEFMAPTKTYTFSDNLVPGKSKV